MAIKTKSIPQGSKKENTHKTHFKHQTFDDITQYLELNTWKVQHPCKLILKANTSILDSPAALFSRLGRKFVHETALEWILHKLAYLHKQNWMLYLLWSSFLVKAKWNSCKKWLNPGSPSTGLFFYLGRSDKWHTKKA